MSQIRLAAGLGIAVGLVIWVATGVGCGAKSNLLIDDTDASILASNWHEYPATWTQGDFSGDKLIDEEDVAIMAANWLSSASLPEVIAAMVVPEPAIAVLLLSGLVPLAVRRLRRVRTTG